MKHIIIFLAINFITILAYTQDSSSAYQIGDRVEDFTLTSTNGDQVSLSTYNANGYIVIFTSNVCPFATASEDRMVQIHNDLAPLGYPIIAINSNSGDAENLKAMKTNASDNNFPFAYLKDDIALYEKFGATKTPHVFLLDEDRVVQYMGSIDDNPQSAEDAQEHYLVDAVHSLIDYKKPDPAFTKSIGCPIKRGDGKAGHTRRKGPPNPQSLIEEMDADHDNQISKAEAKGPLAEDFERIDANGDGLLTVAEISSTRPKNR